MGAAAREKVRQEVVVQRRGQTDDTYETVRLRAVAKEDGCHLPQIEINRLVDQASFFVLNRALIWSIV